MRRCLISATVVASLLCASCGGEEPPPEGYHLELRFVSVDPSVFSEVQVRFEPDGMEQFTFVEPMSFEDGAIRLSVDSMDGTLLLTLDGAHVNQRAVDQGDGSSVYDLEVWSNDGVMRTRAPSVRVVGLRGTEQIAEGFLFLPQWPLPLGQISRINVACRPGVSDRCIP